MAEQLFEIMQNDYRHIEHQSLEQCKQFLKERPHYSKYTPERVADLFQDYLMANGLAEYDE